MKLRLLIASLAFSLPLGATAASAQYPTKPVRLIVPFPAGGPTDTVARVIGQALSKPLGQQIIVDNRTGADGLIAAQAALQGQPDGHTLLFGVGSMMALPLLRKNAPFDWATDFAPVTTVGRFAFALYVHPGVPAKSVSELIAHARANPGQVKYASATLSEFLAAVQFMKAARVSMLRVPYKGSTQAMPDLIAGRVQIYFTPVSAGQQYVADGRLRILGVLLPKRSPAVPEVPTMAEVGMPNVSVPSWQAVFGPAKTPRDIVERLSRELNAVLRDTEVQAQLDRQSLQVEGSTPAALAAIIKADLRMWDQFIRENDIPRE
jgi:tripartite-type tricarboxylate transporter receptor subunit TctC